MNEPQRYGALLKAAIDARGQTAKDFAQEVGWSQSVVSDLINGKRTVVPPETVRRVWLTLGISVRSQLIALGYVDADEPEPGIAYVIREGDPRATLLAILDGMPDHRVENITRAIALLAGVSGETTRGTGPSERDGTG